ncbi:MAG: hypothetical protein LBB38_03585, partial [Puniceicoccales bacterium]|nr:hypothetical protein [Puniceicoccales bacterium]
MTPEAVKPNHGVGLGPAAVGNLTKIGSNVSATAFLYVCRGLTVLVSPLFLIFAIFTLLADMFTLFHFRVTVSLFGVLARLWRRENAQANAVKTANKKVNLQPTPEKLADSSASVVAVPGAAASFPFSPSEIAKAAETGLTVTDAGGICYKEFAIRDSGETAETEPGTDDVAKSEQVRLHVENDDVAAFMEMVGGLGGAKPTHMITLERAADGDVPRLGKCYVLVVANAVNTLRVWVKKAAAEPPRAEPPRAEPLHAEPPHVEPPRVEPELTVEQKQQIGEAGDDHPVRFFDGARYEADANSGGIVPVVDPVNLTSAMRFRSDGDDITHHTLFVEPGDPNENDA